MGWTQNYFILILTLTFTSYGKTSMVKLCVDYCNRQLQGHTQGKRNINKAEMATNNYSDSNNAAKDTTSKKKKINVNSYIPKINDGEGKLKNYISTVLSLESEFEDLLDTSLIRKIVNEIMCRQDLKKFVSKCQNFQIPEETLFLILNSAMSALGLANCLSQIKKDNEVDNHIPKIVELLSWVCEVERCTLYLYNSEKACLYIKATTGRVRENVEIPTKKEDFVVDSFLNGKMIVKNSISEDKKAKRMWLDSKIGAFTQNILCMPINYADFSIGVLELTNKNRSIPFTEIDINLIEKCAKILADGLLQEEMTINLKSEQMKQKQLERKLNSNNLKVYVPLFNGLCRSVEMMYNCQKAVLFLYDKEIDHLFSVPQIDDDLNQKDVIKIHSKRGFLGKVFSEKDVFIAEGDEVDKQLEIEEKNLSKIDSSLKTINNTIAFPIDSKLEEKTVGILQLYNIKQFDSESRSKTKDGAFLENWRDTHQESVESLLEYIANLIQVNEKSREIVKKQEIQEYLLNVTNEALIQTDSQNIIQFCSKSTELMFNRKYSSIIGFNINDLFNMYNPEIVLMIKDIMIQNYKDHAVFECIGFNVVNKINQK